MYTNTVALHFHRSPLVSLFGKAFDSAIVVSYLSTHIHLSPVHCLGQKIDSIPLPCIPDILFQYSSLSLCHSNEIKQHARVCFSIFSFDLKSFCFPFFLFGRGERSQTNEKPNHKIRKNPDERANKPKRKDTHTQVPSITKENKKKKTVIEKDISSK